MDSLGSVVCVVFLSNHGEGMEKDVASGVRRRRRSEGWMICMLGLTFVCSCACVYVCVCVVDMCLFDGISFMKAVGQPRCYIEQILHFPFVDETSTHSSSRN